MEFCKAFNAQTQQMEKGTPIPVVITIYQDRSFTFEMKTPPVSYFIKKAAKLESGSKTPGRDKAGSVTKAQVREIAEKKMKDLNCRHDRGGHAHDRRLRPLDGHRGGGVRPWQQRKTHDESPRGHRSRQALSARRSGEDGQGTRQGEVRRDHRGGDESRRRSAPCRPDGARRGQPAERLRPHACASRVFARGAKAEEAQGRGADVVGAEDLVEKVKAARSISTAASPPRT